MKHQWLYAVICGGSLSCLVPAVTPGVVGCYELTAPKWSPHLRPYPSALPQVIALDSVFSTGYWSGAEPTASRWGWPHNDSLRITWSNEHSDWLLLPGDTIAVPRDGPPFHRLPPDSIVVRMTGRFGGFNALLAADGSGGFRGLAFHRDERTFRQYSMPLAMHRTSCPPTWTLGAKRTGAT